LITVNKAILRGHLTVTLPVLLILIGLPFLYSYLENVKFISVILKHILIVLSFFLAWAYWSFFIVKWKLWAYKNVSELDELKLIAIQQGLIWRDGSIFEKTEIKTKTEKQILKDYEIKFHNKSDVPNVGVFKIYFSKKRAIVALALVLPLFAFSLFLIYMSKSNMLNILISVAICLVFGFLTFLNFRNFLNRKPQLIFSDKGIEVGTGKFYSWAEIRDEQITIEINKTTLYFLTFNHFGGAEKILLNDLATNHLQIEKLLANYKDSR